VTERSPRLVVACAAEASYAQPLAVMLSSLVAATPPAVGLDVYAADDGLTGDDRSRVERSLPARLRLRWVTPHWPADLVLPSWGRMPRTPFLKLFLADWLPADVTRVLWLDCDLVICADPTPLWSEPFDGCVALAVRDRRVPRVASRFGIAAWSELGLPATAEYFNSGVMLIDLTAWRASGIAAAATDYLMRYRDRVVFWDQEALNAALAGRWRRVSGCWNHDPTLDGIAGATSRDAAPDDGGEPAVVHFCGRLKPWVYGPMSPSHARYFEHLEATPWAGWRPRVPPLRRAMAVYSRSRLRRLLYPLEAAWTVCERALSRHDLDLG
jgi:lipopolysaccharide biosynthesis glycosyltransferase